MTIKWQKYKRYFAIVLSSCILVLIINKLVKNPSLHFNNEFKRSLYGSVSSENKTILLWNSFFDDINWGLRKSKVDQTFFERINCPQTNCIVTRRKNFQKSVEDFDAILFHTSFASRVLATIPRSRKANQIYVYVNHESPAHTYHGFNISRFYNWTLTYRFDSDTIYYYGKVFDLETEQMVAPKPFPEWREVESDFELDPATEALIAGKTKMAAWFVSRCGAPSRRDQLVKSLQKYINVDIYGKCGPFRCPKRSNACNAKLNTQYKFYLAFENSLCVDYVTEKLFRAMGHAIIPIVYGGGNYSNFAPPYSYINVEDYENVDELGEYLMFLDKNPQEYKKYFWWKKFYKIEAPKVEIPFCDICVNLNNPAMTTKVQFYEDIEKWQTEDKCRSKAKIKF